MAAQFARQLEAAGWRVEITAKDYEPTLYSDGHEMLPAMRSVSLTAFGPVVGSHVFGHWLTRTPAKGSRCRTSTSFASGSYCGSVYAKNRKITSPSAFATWVSIATV
jgi:hypothetical protein